MKRNCHGNNCGLCRSSQHHELLHDFSSKIRDFNRQNPVNTEIDSFGGRSVKDSVTQSVNGSNNL